MTRGCLACVLACVVGRAMETTGARDGPNTRDDGAMVLYARAPVVRVGEGTTVGNAMGARESAVLVRCLAAIASASGRELVLTTAEETPEGGTRAATRFVAPTTARWRYWREGDDVRVKDGNEDWCVKVNRAGTTMGAAAVVKRFKKAREACVTVASARDECGDEVEMALTSRPNASEELPEEIAALVRENIVRDVAISEEDEGLALQKRRREERVEARKAARRGVDVSGYLGRLEENATDSMSSSSTTTSASVKEGIPELKILRGAARRTGGGAARAVDSSRALIYFAAAVGVVGFFVNMFATSRQTSKRDELAALMLDPNGGAGKAYASAPKRRENHQHRAEDA